MKLPLAWLWDYLPEHARGARFTELLAAACHRWGLEPANDPAQTLGHLMTFSGFACDGVEKLKVAGNEFGIKVRVVREPNPEAKFLVYIPAARPADSAIMPWNCNSNWSSGVSDRGALTNTTSTPWRASSSVSKTW